MLEGKAVDGSGGLDSVGSVDQLFDAEIQILGQEASESSGPGTSIRDSFLGVLSNTYGSELVDPVREQFKINWLADWATKEVGIKSPNELLSLLHQMSIPARVNFPKVPMIDAIYRLARQQRAIKDMEEAGRP